jgi:hypothetical protein
MRLINANAAAYAAVTLLVGPTPASSQSNEIGESDYSSWFPIKEFPNAQAANLSYWQAEAQTLAGADNWSHYVTRCIETSQKYPEVGSSLDGFVAPARVFDNLLFLGASSVSCWAIETSEGLIMIDAMWNPDDIKTIVLPGLEKFGYQGSDIKALIITHEHLDHYGGAGYIQTTFGTEIYASEPAWEVLDTVEGGPRQGQTVGDGENVTLGDTSITVYSTPGHTDGTVSLHFPVAEGRKKYLAGMFGGVGLPRSGEDMAIQIESFEKFATLAEEHGVSVHLGNHQSHDLSLPYLDVLANRQCEKKGKCSLPNPYVVGTERYARYLRVMGMCVRIKAAREDINLRI